MFRSNEEISAADMRQFKADRAMWKAQVEEDGAIDFLEQSDSDVDSMDSDSTDEYDDSSDMDYNPDLDPMDLIEDAEDVSFESVDSDFKARWEDYDSGDDRPLKKRKITDTRSYIDLTQTYDDIPIEIDLSKEIDDIINKKDPEIIDLTKSFEEEKSISIEVAEKALEENKENIPPAQKPFTYPPLKNWIFNPPRKQSQITQFFPVKK